MAEVPSLALTTSSGFPRGSILCRCCSFCPLVPVWQDPAGNRIKQRPPDHRKKIQTEVVWTCLPFIRSGQNHLARHSERRKNTRQTKTTTTTKNQVGIQHQGTYKPGVCQIPEGSGEQRKMEETGCEVIRGAPTVLAVKGYVR